MAILTQPLLETYRHAHIKDICLNQFDENHFNHCAHFVGHVLQLSHGKTCHRMVHLTHRVMDGGTILVSDLFDITPNVRELLLCPATGQGLIYVSAPTSFLLGTWRQLKGRFQIVAALLQFQFKHRLVCLG